MSQTAADSAEEPGLGSPRLEEGLCEITEGTTKLLVPRTSLEGTSPSSDIAFYNPRAGANRDIAVAAYAAFLDGFGGPRTILEPLAGVGATGIRAASEYPAGAAPIQHICQNDANPSAGRLAKRSAALNSVDDIISTNSNEACRFLSRHASRGTRGAIVDVDPFGSPAPFFDCAVRSVYHGGMIACTATDMQVLNGLYDHACINRYGGTPIRGTTYGAETAIRLVLGCLRSVAARLDVSIRPLLVTVHMHYYRMYVQVRMGHAGTASDEMGHLAHCDACGWRSFVLNTHNDICPACNTAGIRMAGPLWRGAIFDEKFVGDALKMMHLIEKKAGSTTYRSAEKMLSIAAEEATVRAGPFYTVDEVASRVCASPPRVMHVIEYLRDAGHAASQTCMSPTGFRTDAPIDAIRGAFGSS